ncbi:MAG: hypothetical protein AB2A00_22510 [Myxococcota bacterium]
MRSGKASLLALLVLGGCAGGKAAQRADADDGKRHLGIVVDSGILDQGNVSAAWLGYGAALAVGWTTADEKKEAPNLFHVELEARKSLRQIWKELNEKTPEKDAYLDELAQIIDAGFGAEYVVTSFALPGYTLTAEEVRALRLAEFDAWRRQTMPTHKPLTLARVEPDKSFRQPVVLGHGLFSTEEVKARSVRCGSVLKTFPARLSEFETQARQSEARPYVFSSREDLLRTLTDEATAVAARERGVHWASPRVRMAYFLVGFCHVDKGAMTSAERVLRQLLVFNPHDVEGMSELAQALLGQKRFQDALPLLEAAVRLESDDGCTRARRLRQLGFALIELDRLEEARLAYEESLRWEPKHPNPPQELAYIEKLQRRKGTPPEKPVPKPGPTTGNTKQTISVCTEKQ